MWKVRLVSVIFITPYDSARPSGPTDRSREPARVSIQIGPLLGISNGTCCIFKLCAAGGYCSLVNLYIYISVLFSERGTYIDSYLQIGQIEKQM